MLLHTLQKIANWLRDPIKEDICVSQLGQRFHIYDHNNVKGLTIG